MNSLKSTQEKHYTDVFSNLKVHLIPCREDNYSFVLETENKAAHMIDSSLEEPVLNFLEKNELKLQNIALTHHHYDHVDQIQNFQKKYACKIYCSEFDSKRPDVKGKTTLVSQGSEINFGSIKLKVIETPGHTRSHLSYYIEDQNLLFCGDTVFSLGCGRVFEKYETVFDDFYQSMQKIKEICDEKTMIYCAHEYTLANFHFLKNQGLADDSLLKTITNRFASDQKTVPTNFFFEKKHNPFLMAKSKLDFQRLRQAKDRF